MVPVGTSFKVPFLGIPVVDKTPLVAKVPIVVGNIPHKEAFDKLSKGGGVNGSNALPDEIKARYPGMPEPKISNDKEGCKRIDYT